MCDTAPPPPTHICIRTLPLQMLACQQIRHFKLLFLLFRPKVRPKVSIDYRVYRGIGGPLQPNNAGSEPQNLQQQQEEYR